MLIANDFPEFSLPSGNRYNAETFGGGATCACSSVCAFLLQWCEMISSPLCAPGLLPAGSTAFGSTSSVASYRPVILACCLFSIIVPQTTVIFLYVSFVHLDITNKQHSLCHIKLITEHNKLQQSI